MTYNISFTLFSILCLALILTTSNTAFADVRRENCQIIHDEFGRYQKCDLYELDVKSVQECGLERIYDRRRSRHATRNRCFTKWIPTRRFLGTTKRRLSS